MFILPYSLFFSVLPITKEPLFLEKWRPVRFVKVLRGYTSAIFDQNHFNRFWELSTFITALSFGQTITHEPAFLIKIIWHRFWENCIFLILSSKNKWTKIWVHEVLAIEKYTYDTQPNDHSVNHIFRLCGLLNGYIREKLNIVFLTPSHDFLYICKNMHETERKKFDKNDNSKIYCWLKFV